MKTTDLKHRAFCLVAAAFLSSTVVAQEKQEGRRELPADVLLKLREAQDLQSRQRYVDAMTKLDEVEAAAPELPDVYNLRGSIYLSPALRDFTKAREQFLKAQELRPEDLAPKFNLAELLFVKHEWAGAEAAFQKLLDDYPKIPMHVRHLALFKRLICEAKQNKLEAAEKTLKDNYTFMDDTPAYYFSKAVIAFQQGKEDDAKNWIARANGIFKKADNSAYEDSLMEARWLPNIGLPAAEPAKE